MVYPIPVFALNESKSKDIKAVFPLSNGIKCALDRIFDDAVVYMIQGESYRGKNLETYSIATTANRNKLTITMIS